MLLRRHVVLGPAALAAASCGTTLIPGSAQARRPAAQGGPASQPLVLIDPGHGGKDPGCIGAGGTLEKHVALAVAQDLRRELLASGRYRVAMTRDSDVFIPLGGRVEHARRLGAALFVSLHANASPNRMAHGTCVYRFAWRASDAHAASLARWENSAERFDDPALRGASRQVLHILATLMRRETRVHAERLQRAMVEGLRPHVRLLPMPAPHARFAVLGAPDVPGVLVEMGFLSNRQDEALLGRRPHRLVLARAMRHAVDTYFAALPRTARRTG